MEAVRDAQHVKRNRSAGNEMDYLPTEEMEPIVLASKRMLNWL